jgi:hypothetical protein
MNRADPRQADAGPGRIDRSACRAGATEGGEGRRGDLRYREIGVSVRMLIAEKASKGRRSAALRSGPSPIMAFGLRSPAFLQRRVVEIGDA